MKALLRAWPLLALLLLPACEWDSTAMRVQGYLLTYYTSPQHLRPGSARVGLRVQDRNYQIVTPLSVQARCVQTGGESLPMVELQPGQGKDFSGRILIPHAGDCRLEFEVRIPEGKQLRALCPQVVVR